MMMKRLKNLCLAAMLCVGCSVFAQEEETDTELKTIELPKTESLMPFEHMAGMNMKWGIEGLGFSFSYLYNQNQQISDWDFMVGGEVTIMNVYDDDKKESQAGFFEVQAALSKRLSSDQAYILLKGGVALGNEQYEDEFEREKSNFLFGISAQQNFIYLPKDGEGIILQAGLYEYVIPTSKVYAFDIGLNIGIGYKF